MRDAITTVSLVALTLLCMGASVLAVGRLLAPAWFGPSRKAQYALLGACTLGCVALFLYRALFVYHGWQPLESHVDGLLLIAALFAVTVLFLQSRGGLPGLTTFGLPVMTLILAWAICASAWTFQLFRIDSVWMTVHLSGVYLGTLFFAIAAIGGGMFLFAQHRLRHKHVPASGRRLASLEATEGLIVWTSAMGFGLLTLGLVTGAIVLASGPRPKEPGWWYSSKIILGAAVWLIYALVMNTRHATAYRGSRAAWMSILGLALILTAFGVVEAWPARSTRAPSAAGADGLSNSQEVP